MKIYPFLKYSAIVSIISFCFSPDASLSEKRFAIIFDCDGVLVDSEMLKYKAWKMALSEINVEFSVEDYKPLIGHSGAYIAQAIQKLKSISTPWEKFMKRRNEIYKELHANGAPAIKSAIAFVHHLLNVKSHSDFKLGLASSPNRAEIDRNLNAIGLTNAFDVVISGKDDLKDIQDPAGTNKPKPYIYLKAAKNLGVLPQNCLVFEDTQAGIEAATGAGMMAIAVPNEMTKDQDFSKAKQIISSFDDISIEACFRLLKNRTQE